MFESYAGSNSTFSAGWVEFNVWRLCNFICAEGASVFYFYANFPKQNLSHVSLPSQEAGLLSHLTEASLARGRCPSPD